jgi:hypothetical protein
MQTTEEIKEKGYYLKEISTRDLEEGEEAYSPKLAGVLFLALIGAISFILGALTCYLTYGLRH